MQFLVFRSKNRKNYLHASVHYFIWSVITEIFATLTENIFEPAKSQIKKKKNNKDYTTKVELTPHSRSE